MATLVEQAPKLCIDGTYQAFGVPRMTYFRHRVPACEVRPPRKLPPKERQAVLDVLHEPRFVDLAPAEAHAMLLAEDRYLCSVRTMRRILAENSESKEMPTEGRR